VRQSVLDTIDLRHLLLVLLHLLQESGSLSLQLLLAPRLIKFCGFVARMLGQPAEFAG
jgi:hypothetical protein